MIFDDFALNTLRSEVQKRLSKKRYEHTIGVEKMAMFIGNIILPDKIDELCVASLLHDIAKEMCYEEQLDLLINSNVNYTREDLAVKPALHSFTAVPVVKEDFSQYATEDVLSAVFNHTLGAPGMSVFDEIIFISDYAEDGRLYPICNEVNNFIKTNMSREKSKDENLVILHQASITAIKSTIDSLKKGKEAINKRTIETYDYLNEKLKNAYCFLAETINKD